MNNSCENSLEWATKLFNTIKAGVVVIDPESKTIVDANNQALVIIGKSRESIIGHPCSDNFCNGCADKCSVLKADKDAVIEDFESHVERSDGSIITILKTLNVLFCGDKKYLIESFTDITPLKDNEERINSLLTLSERKFDNEKSLATFALDEAVRLTKSEVGYLHFVVGQYRSDDVSLNLFIWSSDASKYCTVDPKIVKKPYALSEAGIWADCLRVKHPVVHNDYLNYSDKKGYPEGHFPIIRHMSVPIIDYQNKVVAIMGVGNKTTDYTDLDVHQLQLFANNMWSIIKRKRTEAQHRLLVEKSPVMIYDFDLTDMRFLMADGNIKDLLGFDKDEILNMTISDLIHPDDQPRVYDCIDSAHNGAKNTSTELINRLTTKHGDPIWGLFRIKCEVNEEGHIISHGVCSDITDLHESEIKAQTYLDIVPSIIVALDAFGNITMINRFGMNILECGNEVIGSNWFDMFVSDLERDDVKKIFNELVCGNTLFSNYEHEIYTNKGNKRIIAWQNSVLKNTNDEIINIIAAGNDITDQRMAEKELESRWAGEEERLEFTLRKLSVLHTTDK